MWLDSPEVVRQFSGIGEKLATLLVNADITSFEKVIVCDPRRLEAIT
jgi:hypothetical protein